MKTKIKACAAVLLLVVTAVLFSSCDKYRKFEPSGVTSQAPESTAVRETTTYAISKDKLNFLGVQMGMSTDQVQIAIGQANPIYTKNDKMFFTATVKGLSGIDQSIAKTAYYIFNAQNSLVEIQYVVSSADDVTYKKMVDEFKTLYGKGVEIKSEIGKTETILEYKDVYAIVAKNDDKETVVSYFEKAFFELENNADVVEYNKAK